MRPNETQAELVGSSLGPCSLQGPEPLGAHLPVVLNGSLRLGSRLLVYNSAVGGLC